MKEALFYQKKDGVVECGLCMHRCIILPGKRGICGVRENREGTLYSLVYGKLSAEHVDPVEKKPLFHFLPGSLTYSIATIGCNFRCLHCQNHTLSQVGSGEVHTSRVSRRAEDIVESGLAQGCRSISYTYVEPTIFFEFAHDCCVIARENGLKNIFVSNGFMSREAARMLIPVLDAINIDIKAFTDEFYRNVCGGRLGQVLDNVRFFREQGVWVEVTTLLIPGLNDSDDEIRSIAECIVGVDPDIVWHVSAFRPAYKMMNRQPASAKRLQSARRIGRDAGVNHVYVGNIHGDGGEDTFCPACGRSVIMRSGFRIVKNMLDSNRCPFCAAEIAGVWQPPQ